MFSWFKRKDVRADRQQGTALYGAVAEALAKGSAKGRAADDETVRIVASVAALLLCVAYADQDYADEEEALVANTLQRIQGLGASGVQAVLGVLRAHMVIIVAAESSTYARELLELTDDDFRLQLLDTLMDVAAADSVITVAETNMLRTVTRSLGLSQAAYNAAQGRHRDKLAVLSG